MHAVGVSVFLLAVSAVSSQPDVRKCRFVGQPPAVQLRCRRIRSEVEFEEQLVGSSAANASELLLQSSHFRYFVHDVFSGTKFKHIKIQNCSILNLSNSKYGFKGLENYLKDLTVEDTSYVSQWNWKHLKKLKTLKDLTVRNCDLIHVPNEMQNVSRKSLEVLELVNNGIRTIGDSAFSRLRELKYLTLDHNNIVLVQRSMFPSLNNALEVLSLSYNRIYFLPDDIFSDMALLKVLKLSGNLIWTLKEEVFSPVWEQLFLLSLSDCPLSCDCRLRWITKMKKRPKMIFSVCNQPAALKGKFLTSLQKKHLFC